MNIADAVLFIKKYTDSSKNPWSDSQLVRILQDSINDRVCIFSVERGELTGIAFGSKENHTVFCLGLVLRPDRRKELLKTYLNNFKQRFKGYKLQAKRHGKIKDIDYGSILSKLS